MQQDFGYLNCTHLETKAYFRNSSQDLIKPMFGLQFRAPSGCIDRLLCSCLYGSVKFGSDSHAFNVKVVHGSYIYYMKGKIDMLYSIS